MTLHYPLKIAVAMFVKLKKPSFSILQIGLSFLLIVFLTEECLAQVYIPQQDRCSNYGDSCVHASTINAIYSKCKHCFIAKFIRSNYSGGDYHYELNLRLRKWGIKTYSTFSSSKQILDYAHVNFLPAIISYHRDHSCLFLGWYVNPKTRIITHAYVLNPNNTSILETPTYNQFMRNWIRNDGEAIVIVPK